jgi:hypothetical protein
MERPALKQLLTDIEAKKVDIIVVYKVDCLTRSRMDFAKLVELMDKAGVSFVSVTQQFNTTTSMGRLTLNVLLSFAHLSVRLRVNVSWTKLPYPNSAANGWVVCHQWVIEREVKLAPTRDGSKVVVGSEASGKNMQTHQSHHL